MKVNRRDFSLFTYFTRTSSYLVLSYYPILLFYSIHFFFYCLLGNIFLTFSYNLGITILYINISSLISYILLINFIGNLLSRFDHGFFIFCLQIYKLYLLKFRLLCSNRKQWFVRVSSIKSSILVRMQIGLLMVPEISNNWD